MLGTMYEINFYKYNFLHADLVSFFCYHLLTFSLIYFAFRTVLSESPPESQTV